MQKILLPLHRKWAGREGATPLPVTKRPKTMTYNKRRMWMTAKDYIFIILGILLYSFGFTAFILPEKVVIGGVSGVASILYFTLNVPVAVTTYVINIILLAMAYKTVGKTFVIRTLFGATVLSLFIGILQPMFPEPLVHQEMFMNVTIGGILCGLGLGLVFVHNGSTGGTDIIAAMVAKYTNVSIGRTMIYVDFCIISSSYLIFHQVDKVVSGFVILFIVSYLTDYIIHTNRQAVQFTIFSQHWEKIANAIIGDAHRGCTVCKGIGWYTKQETHYLLVMCRKIESVTIYRIIKSIDPDAFITQTNVGGVYGKGFDHLKFKEKKKQEKIEENR